MEFTKLDEIVNLVFSTAEDLKQDEEQTTTEENDTDANSDKKFVPVSFHAACIQKDRARIEGLIGEKVTRVLCILRWSTGSDLRGVQAI